MIGACLFDCINFVHSALASCVALAPVSMQSYALCRLHLSDQDGLIHPQRFLFARNFPVKLQEISRGETTHFPRLYALFVKRKPIVDGRLGSHLPARLP